MGKNQNDLEDGIALDKRFNQQGRVPLFYAAEASQQSDEEDLAVYFSRRDLIRDWSTTHSGVLPTIKAVDLETVFTLASTGRENEIPGRGKLRFVPYPDSLIAAKELTTKGLPPYNPKLMII